MRKNVGRRGRLGPLSVAVDVPAAVPAVDLSAMSWNELRSHAADRGVLQAGMTKAQVLAALRAA